MTKKNILLISKDGLYKAMMQMMISDLGYKCSTADEGLEALNRVTMLRFSAQPVDLVVFDFSVPVLSPDPFVRNLRAIGMEVPILVLSHEERPMSLKSIEIFRGIRMLSYRGLSSNLKQTLSQMLEESESELV